MTVPGNFLLNAKGEMGIIDFGCVKEIPQDFYDNYFSLLKPGFLEDKEEIDKRFKALDFFHEKDTPAERKIFNEVFKKKFTSLDQISKMKPATNEGNLIVEVDEDDLKFLTIQGFLFSMSAMYIGPTLFPYALTVAAMIWAYTAIGGNTRDILNSVKRVSGKYRDKYKESRSRRREEKEDDVDFNTFDEFDKYSSNVPSGFEWHDDKEQWLPQGFVWT